jgi:2-oxoisovalerate dehydrogenase E2 component (dihydrolipoyl transacylase)
MAKEFLLPELAESVVEGEIVRWIVQEGQRIKRDQPIVEVMTDKVTVELVCPYTGILEKHLVKEGDVVPVNTPLARIVEAGEQAASSKDQSEDGKTMDKGESLSLFKPSAAVKNEAVFQIRKSDPEDPLQKTRGAFGRVLAVPVARRLARELGVNLEHVSGSGENGRVRVEDVKAFMEVGGQVSGFRENHVPETPNPKPETLVNFKSVHYKTPEGYEALEERIPLRGLRRLTSQQMLASHLQTVRTLHVDEAEVTALVNLRERLKPVAEKQGVKLSYLPFIMKAVVAALKAFPMINASLDEARDEIVRKHYYNLSMAVNTEQGLVVPVVKDVDKKGLLELARDLSSIAAKARDNKLTSDDVRGGTFSISNIGSLGGLFSFPIINVPEAAILGVHSIKKRPVVLEDDSIVARQMLYLSLSFDHRLIDGAEAVLFSNYLIDLIEAPEGLMLEN